MIATTGTSCRTAPSATEAAWTVAANHGMFQDTAAFYDAQFTDRMADVDFYLRAAVKFGGPVVEIGCGTGRILAPIVAAGVPATGVDHSPAMLAAAFDRCSGQAALVNGDFREAHKTLGPTRQVLFSFGVLQYLLDPSDQVDTLDAYSRLLVPGGRLLVDVKAWIDDPVYRDALTKPVSRPPVTYPHPDGQVQVTTLVTVDRAAQVVTERVHTTVLNAEGQQLRQIEHTHAMRAFTLPELTCLARAAGLTVKSVATSYGGPTAQTSAGSVGSRYLLDLRP
jgi:trans-aconitate methyltransferase